MEDRKPESASESKNPKSSAYDWLESLVTATTSTPEGKGDGQRHDKEPVGGHDEDFVDAETQH